MKNRGIFILFLIILTFIFSINISAFESDKKSIDNNTVEKTINNYFSIYFKSLEDLENPNYENVIANNINTSLYIAINELQVEQNKISNLAYQNTDFNLNYEYINIDENIAEISVLMGCTYNYSTTPDSESSMSGIKYNFVLDKRDNNWVITNIDTNFEAFDRFKEELNKRSAIKKGTLPSLNESDIAETKLKLIDDTKEASKYLGGN